MEGSQSTLCLSGLNLKSMNERFIEHPEEIEHLDLSMNQLKTGKDLGKFPKLHTLIIDNNFFHTISDIPVLKSLDTFSANKN